MEQGAAYITMLAEIMKPLFIIALLFLTSSFLHAQLNYGKVIGDTANPCNTSFIHDAAFMEAELCKSKAPFELHFSSGHLPSLYAELIIIRFDGKSWSAEKYKDNRDSAFTTIPAKVVRVSLRPKKGDFEQVFNDLKKNRVFTLPSFNNLKPYKVVDGLQYSLSFKADNQFGGFFFHNPSILKKHYPLNRNIRNYQAIVKILSELQEE